MQGPQGAVLVMQSAAPSAHVGMLMRGRWHVTQARQQERATRHAASRRTNRSGCLPASNRVTAHPKGGRNRQQERGARPLARQGITALDVLGSDAAGVVCEAAVAEQFAR